MSGFPVWLLSSALAPAPRRRGRPKQMRALTVLTCRTDRERRRLEHPQGGRPGYTPEERAWLVAEVARMRRQLIAARRREPSWRLGGREQVSVAAALRASMLAHGCTPTAARVETLRRLYGRWARAPVR